MPNPMLTPPPINSGMLNPYADQSLEQLQAQMTLPENAILAPQEQSLPQAPQGMLAPQPAPQVVPQGIGGLIEQYAAQNGGSLGLIQKGLAGLDEAYLQSQLTPDQLLTRKNQLAEAEQARQKQMLDSLALEYDIQYKKQDLEVKRENLFQQRALLGMQLAGQNISNQVALAGLGIRTNPMTGETTYIPPRPDTTQAQDLARGFASRLAESDPIIAQFQDVGTDLKEVSKGSVPLVGNFIVTPEYQQLDQAKRNFINATLRRESGAAIGPSEFENANKQYLPVPGDSPEVLAQKAANRQTVIKEMAYSAGAGYQLPQSPAIAPTIAPVQDDAARLQELRAKAAQQ